MTEGNQFEGARVVTAAIEKLNEATAALAAARQAKSRAEEDERVATSAIESAMADLDELVGYEGAKRLARVFGEGVKKCAGKCGRNIVDDFDGYCWNEHNARRKAEAEKAVTPEPMNVRETGLPGL